MKHQTILCCVVALILGMLLANMLQNVFGCKLTEGQFVDNSNADQQQSAMFGGLNQNQTQQLQQLEGGRNSNADQLQSAIFR